jgi:pimeloyl-ACP methyl ester carboxylesterase
MTDKTNLVLVPGLLCSKALWEGQIEALSDVANILVADAASAPSMAEIAANILAKAPETFALAGLSMGGAIALEILRQAPERVERVAFLDANPGQDTEEKRARRHELIELCDQGDFRDITAALMPLLIHPDRNDDTALVEAIFNMAEDVGPAGFKNQQSALIERIDSVPGLGDIKCPTLVVVGRQDILTPLELSQEIANGIPGAELVIIENCGHMSTMERPVEINAVLRNWLSS